MSALSTHSKMLVAPARLNLHRGASYNHHDRGPFSSPSSRFNFNHLLLVSRAWSRDPRGPPARSWSLGRAGLIRRLFFLAGLLTAVYLLAVAFQNRDGMPSVWPYFSQEEFEMVGQDAVPDFPTPNFILVKDVF